MKHAIGAETECPRRIEPGARVAVVTRFDASGGQARVRIGDGPEVPLRTGRVLGLSWVGLAVASGGVVRVRSVRAVRS